MKSTVKHPNQKKKDYEELSHLLKKEIIFC